MKFIRRCCVCIILRRIIPIIKLPKPFLFLHFLNYKLFSSFFKYSFRNIFPTFLFQWAKQIPEFSHMRSSFFTLEKNHHFLSSALVATSLVLLYFFLFYFLPLTVFFFRHLFWTLCLSSLEAMKSWLKFSCF